MKKIFLVITLFALMNQAQAYEPSECDGMSIWKKSIKNSPDIMTRTCNIFGMNYIEVKSQLKENRCIVVTNTKTGDQWKYFFLHKQSIKSLGSPLLDPEDFTVASNSVKEGRCNS
ncbi:hypothetical protein ICN18_06990 [Polynucleobacter sp. Ross1-W9]|uniref:hypothetical protein n=1 Tax=Polynucleobacter parvulilacunae TaxID=1855631 RepID=UPI001C0D8D9A|nr:hypothetical protein [Polynucleobacter parvulilacunae]MBU3557371.1 hypothetical protein [Polynucleobacter parvulilacunae]